MLEQVVRQLSHDLSLAEIQQQASSAQVDAVQSSSSSAPQLEIKTLKARVGYTANPYWHGQSPSCVRLCLWRHVCLSSHSLCTRVWCLAKSNKVITQEAKAISALLEAGYL